MSRLVQVLLVVLTVSLLALLALVQHTRALTAAHLEVAHLFDKRAPDQRAGGGGEGARGEGGSVPHLEVFSADAAGCVGTPQTELWGDVVVPAVGGQGGAHDAPSAAACCAACARTRGCNVWVWCADERACGTQCWLKRTGDPAKPALHASGQRVPWTSGAMLKDADVSVASLPPADEAIDVVALATSFGKIRLRLQPDWSASSVSFVRLLAAQPLCTPACEFYRVEPGFLLQGSLRALIPANNVTTPGPRYMRKGDVGWAGGGPGPDFFIYLGEQPATHWGFDHTVWAEVADADSMRVAEAIVQLPPLPTKPGEMHMVKDRVPFSVERAGVRGVLAAVTG